ncbi:MAG TPA: SprT-like domain-containing protein [Chitinophagaceae bacterium]|jgi:hypothetical protein|nr:SprT-like domain-containing protein [Chitinophagaceae bacterium]
MPRKEAPLNQLKTYLPEGTYEAVVYYLQHYNIHLTIARERKSILGDYRHKHRDKTHRISVNGNLNTYSFLITLLHEIAHLLTFERFGNRVAAHGKEWKDLFGQLLQRFVQQHAFPADIEGALKRSLENPSASSCADDQLMRVLRQYDEKEENLLFIENMPPGVLFKTGDGRIFQKGEKLRKRFRCTELATKKLYLFSPVYEAEIIEAK